MKIRILAFGIAKEIFNSSFIELELPEKSTVDALKTLLEQQYPRLSQLASYMIAMDNEYVSMSTIVQQNKEIAIVPPVSGG